MTYLSNHGKSWTKEQHLRMLKLYVEQRLTPMSIAEHMGRREDSILGQFSKLRLCECRIDLDQVTPFPRDDPRVLKALQDYEVLCNGIHHRGPNDSGGWPEEWNQQPTETIKEQTMNKTTKFFDTRHFINGVDVTDISDADLVAAIQKETREIAGLEALSPMPRRIAKMIEERKAALQAAIDFLDAQETQHE